MSDRGGGRGGGGRGGGGRGGGRGGNRGKNPSKQQRSIWANSNQKAPGEDRDIDCRDCSKPFAFTARAQALHAEQGYGDPVRCQACRKTKRERNEADVAAGKAGQPKAGLTYEERRVLGKNRKERRAEAVEDGSLVKTDGDSAGSASFAAGMDPAFKKGMDPQEARLLRLAREGKMKRAMHKPEERANFNTVQDRLEKQGEAVVKESVAREGKPIHKRIRDLERRLARGNLPDDLKAAKEAEVVELKQQQQQDRYNSAEEKTARRYKMVKFFEERKIIRRIRSNTKKQQNAATTPEEIEEAEALSVSLHEDLEYVTNYPRAIKYVSLYPKGGLDDYGEGEVAKMRAEIKEIMKRRGGESERSAAARAEAAGMAAAAATAADAKDEAEREEEDGLSEDEFFASVPDEEAAAAPVSKKRPAAAVEEVADDDSDDSDSGDDDSDDDDTPAAKAAPIAADADDSSEDDDDDDDDSSDADSSDDGKSAAEQLAAAKAEIAALKAAASPAATRSGKRRKNA